MINYCYIVAGNRQEFDVYCRRKFDECVSVEPRMKPLNYVYIDSADRLRGLSEVHGFKIGTYKQRPDINEIERMIFVINSKTPQTSPSVSVGYPLKGNSFSTIIFDEVAPIKDEVYKWVNQ